MIKVNLKPNIFFLIILLLSCLIFSACTTCLVKSICPRDVRKSIKYCYNSKPTGLDTIIQIHGYYKMTFRFDRHNLPDSTQTCLIFYQDGLFLECQDFHLYSHLVNNDTVRKMDIVQPYWGNYIVDHDTIKTFYFSQPCETAWSGYEAYYRIIHDKTLTLIFSSELTTRTSDLKYYEEMQKNRIKNTSSARYYKVDRLPDPKGS
jgi:hypothetical protein